MIDFEDDFMDDPEPEEWSEDDPETPYGTTVKVDGWGRIAWRVDATLGDRVRAHMVGDDRPFEFDRADLTLLDREAFCGQCGAIGCTHDGLDREEVA